MVILLERGIRIIEATKAKRAFQYEKQAIEQRNIEKKHERHVTRNWPELVFIKTCANLGKTSWLLRKVQELVLKQAFRSQIIKDGGNQL